MRLRRITDSMSTLPAISGGVIRGLRVDLRTARKAFWMLVFDFPTNRVICAGS
jgi:hypothetical protein